MLRREAANWLARLQSRRDPEIERKFQRWLDRDPAHAEAFERVSECYRQAGLLRYSALASAPSGAQTVESRIPNHAWAAAAAIAILICASLYLALRSGFWTSDTEAVMLSTRVGEIRRVSLSDGSSVTLDTDTSVEIEIGRTARRALVKSGRVRFDIAKAKNPFIIEAGNISTAADGVVDVEEFAKGERVDVLAGSATIGEPRKRGVQLDLTAGQAMAVVGGRDIERQSHASVPDWTRGMLEFDGTPLQAAVELANRYSTRKIVLSGGLEELRVTGAFRAGDIQGLASALGDAFHLSVARSRDGDLILSQR